jgi:tetratricopeptide (TPR) repeat protein
MISFLKRNNPQAIFERALKKVQRGDLKGAYQDFSEVIKLDPTHAEAYFRRGYLLMRNGDPKRAVTDFERALKLNPKHPNAAMMREMIKRVAGLSQREASGAPASPAMPATPPAAPSAPSPAGHAPSAVRGTAALAAPSMSDTFDDLLTRPASEVPASVKDGSSQFKLPTVVPHLDQDDDPAPTAPGVNPTNLLIEADDIFESLNVPNSDTLNNALRAARPKLPPPTPQSFVDRGIQYFDKGLVDEAIDAFVQALTLDPNFAEAYVNLGAIYHEHGEADLAREYFQAALDLDPHHPDAPRMKQILGIATKSLWTADLHTQDFQADGTRTQAPLAGPPASEMFSTELPLPPTSALGPRPEGHAPTPGSQPLGSKPLAQSKPSKPKASKPLDSAPPPAPRIDPDFGDLFSVSNGDSYTPPPFPDEPTERLE